MLYVKTKSGKRKPFNPRAYAMAREEAYMQASCYHPDRKARKPEKVSVPKSNLPAIIRHTIQGEGSIAETTYYVDSKQLVVKFHSGAAFKFFDVEKVVNFGICHAKSADQYLCEVILPKYHGENLAA